MIKKAVVEYRGERIEIVSALAEDSRELREIKGLVQHEYQRRGYIPRDIDDFEDRYEGNSIYFGTYVNGILLSAARLIESAELPTEVEYYRFKTPAQLSKCPRDLLREVSRLTVIKRPGDNPLPRHFLSTTMISALIDYGFKIGLCGGVSTIKVSFLRLFEKLNLPALHEIKGAELIYPSDAVLTRFFYDEASPAVPIYYLHDEAKAIFDGLFRNSIRTGTTLLGEPLRIISYEVLG